MYCKYSIVYTAQRRNRILISKFVVKFNNINQAYIYEVHLVTSS
jgi:hypothetical protein